MGIIEDLANRFRVNIDFSPQGSSSVSEPRGLRPLQSSDLSKRGQKADRAAHLLMQMAGVGLPTAGAALVFGVVMGAALGATIGIAAGPLGMGIGAAVGAATGALPGVAVLGFSLVCGILSLAISAGVRTAIPAKNSGSTSSQKELDSSVFSGEAGEDLTTIEGSDLINLGTESTKLGILTRSGSNVSDSAGIAGVRMISSTAVSGEDCAEQVEVPLDRVCSGDGTPLSLPELEKDAASSESLGLKVSYTEGYEQSEIKFEYQAAETQKNGKKVYRIEMEPMKERWWKTTVESINAKGLKGYNPKKEGAADRLKLVKEEKFPENTDKKYQEFTQHQQKADFNRTTFFIKKEDEESEELLSGDENYEEKKEKVIKPLEGLDCAEKGLGEDDLTWLVTQSMEAEGFSLAGAIGRAVLDQKELQTGGEIDQEEAKEKGAKVTGWYVDLDKNNKVKSLSSVRNYKVVDPKDPESIVMQLEMTITFPIHDLSSPVIVEARPL